jgi:hypothetical protein
MTLLENDQNKSVDMTVGQRIERIIQDMTVLYEITGVQYFKAQASGWSQWVWMLQDNKRHEWQLTIPGDANGG